MPPSALYERAKRELAARDWKYVQHYADAKGEIVEAIIERRRGAGAATAVNVDPRTTPARGRSALTHGRMGDRRRVHVGTPVHGDPVDSATVLLRAEGARHDRSRSRETGGALRR